ncbi:hypothetical protein BDZ97DRAFT_1659688 [Flammula alnicola]|nr:hypothetical protein BDZ97DRAFT_1659688 [Flammula alnicola]
MHVYQSVAILPNGREPGSDIEFWEYWVAKIRDVRAEIHTDGTNTVWAKVQWFYSGKDVADVIKSFDAAAVGRYERIFADHYDFLESESFDAVIPMIKFNENDPEQAYIANDQFYRRYTFEYKARTLKPKPGSSACTCQKPYDPNDNAPSSLMHFCPRPSCRRAYHQKCLLSAKSKESSTTATIVVTKARALRLLACSPDTDEDVDLESLIPLTKKRRGRPSKNPPASVREAHVQEPRSLASILDELPAELLEVAQQPLVRGGAFAKGGVAGNVGFVTRARRLVYEVLEGSLLPEEWKEHVFGESKEVGVENAIVKIAGSRKALPPVVCPHCKSAI